MEGLSTKRMIWPIHWRQHRKQRRPMQGRLGGPLKGHRHGPAPEPGNQVQQEVDLSPEKQAKKSLTRHRGNSKVTTTGLMDMTKISGVAMMMTNMGDKVGISTMFSQNFTIFFEILICV